MLIICISSTLYSRQKHKYNDAMTSYKRTQQSGLISGWLIATICVSILAIGATIAAIWGIMSYTEQKANVDARIAASVATAKKEQADSDETKFSDREKEPNREFVGPDDYGRLTFNYPKTWSVYIGRDVSKGGTFEAYLNPVNVLPVSADMQYALRVTIEERDYDLVLAGYGPLVKKGSLRSGATSVDGNNGTRFDGSFSKDIRGSAVVYKIRDKTVTLRTDADTFKPDFNALIATVKFNQ